MNLFNLKQKLLATGLFIDNDKFNDYLLLVTNPAKVFGYSENHHILPRVFYKHNQLPIDNSADNLVVLSYSDHCYAHWLLYYCTTGYLKKANAVAVSYIQRTYKKITKNSPSVIELDTETFDKLQYYMDDIRQDPDSHYYSKEDMQFLKENYATRGADYCAKKLNKTPSVIYSKAMELKLSKPTKHLRWQPEEMNILKKYFELEGSAVAKRLPNRSETSCRIKAQELNLTRTWSEEDLNILKQYFPTDGANVYKRFNGRSKQACRHMAYKIGLSSARSWTDGEVALLKKLYIEDGLPIIDILEYFPSRTKLSIIGYLKYNKLWRGYTHEPKSKDK